MSGERGAWRGEGGHVANTYAEEDLVDLGLVEQELAMDEVAVHVHVALGKRRIASVLEATKRIGVACECAWPYLGLRQGQPEDKQHLERVVQRQPVYVPSVMVSRVGMRADRRDASVVTGPRRTILGKSR